MEVCACLCHVQVSVCVSVCVCMSSVENVCTWFAVYEGKISLGNSNRRRERKATGGAAPPAGSVGIVHDGLNVVSREETRGAVHHPLIPAVVVLLDHVNDGPLLEGQLVLFVP